MDITAEVFQAATLFRFAMVLVNIILIIFALKQLPELLKCIVDLIDYFAKRRKIQRGHARREYEEALKKCVSEKGGDEQDG